MINWKVRAKNKTFWVTVIPAVALLIQAVAAIFGYVIDLTDIAGKLIAAIEALFVVLVICGIVADPTTKGMSDSQRALSYEAPRDDSKENENG